MSDPDHEGPGGEHAHAPRSLRERKRAQTRRAILEACAEIELFHGGAIDPERLTYARVAEIAGISERTVYRFFPTRQALDEAYAAERPIGLGRAEPRDLDGYAAVIEDITKAWSERMGHVRVAEQEIGIEDYPLSIAARRARDLAFIDRLADLTTNAGELDDRQLRALAAAVHSTVSIRTLAISAQRWNLTLEEAGRAHAWTLRTLLAELTRRGAEPWEDA